MITNRSRAGGRRARGARVVASIWLPLGLAGLAAAACDTLSPSEPGNLVPRTVAEDATLPAIEGKDKAVVTHITHSDWYRQHVYPDARDGWYLDAGGTYHYGVAAGVALGRAELAGRFGWARTEDWKDVLPPVYASVGIGFGF